MNSKFLTNVTHNGVLFKTGDVISGTLDAHESLIARGLVELTADAPTHRSDEGDTSGRALPLDPAVSTEPTAADIDAENAKREQALAQQQAEAARVAQTQVASSQPDARVAQPTPSQIADDLASIQ